MTKDNRHLDDARRSDLAAYALGALPEDEASTLEAHLRDCEECRVHLRWVEPALDALAGSMAQQRPPTRVRESLMATVRAEAEAEAQAGRAQRDSTTPQPWWRRIVAPALRPATGLAAIALLAAGVGGGYVIRGEGGGTDDSSTTVVSAEPVGGSTGATAQLEVREDAATLHVSRLPQLSRNRVYQVWIQRGEVMEPSTIFLPDHSGSGIAAVPGSLEGAERVLVTAEPRGGSEQPTSDPLLAATLG